MEVVERRLSRYFCKLNVLNANMCQIGEYVKNVYKKKDHMWRIWVSCQIISSIEFLVKMQKEEILQELGFIKDAALEP